MLSLFLKSIASNSFTIKAVDKNGNDHDYVLVKYQAKQSLPEYSFLQEKTFPDHEIVRFKITRDDGIDIITPAPQSTKKVAFKVFLTNEIPTSFYAEKRSSGSMPVTVQSLRRAPQIERPQPQQAQQQQKGGGGLGSILPYLLIFFLISRCLGAGRQAAAQ